MVDRQEVRVFNGTWAEDHLHGCTEGALVCTWGEELTYLFVLAIRFIV
jgi:hypothetical protein